MHDTNWNEKAKYLMRTRSLYLNDDYLEFLVRNVWRLETRTDVIEGVRETRGPRHLR